MFNINKLIFIIVGIFLFSTPLVQSTPVIDPKFNEKYQSWLENAITEKLSPKNQLKLGIVSEDVICFENKIPVLKLTVNDSVACVDVNSAKKLEERGWGLQKSTEYADSLSPLIGLHCWDVYFDQSKPSEPQLIKDIRLTLLNLSEKYAWKSIWIEGEEENKFLISTPHLRNDDEITQMVTLLEFKDDISKVIFREYSCSK